MTAAVRALAVAVVLAATALTFRPMLEHGLLNWDDPRVVGHPRLADSPGRLVTWAATTTDMQHYQPLAWLAYGAIARAGDRAAAVHAASLALHVLNVALLFWLTTRLLSSGDDDGDWWIPAATTALFAVHPMRVEPVAWASALPYLLSYAPLLVATGCWLAWLRGGTTRVLAAAVGLYAVSQLVRVTAPLYPLVLVTLAGAVPAARARPFNAVVRAAAVFAVIAVPLGWMEAGAREIESLTDIGLEPRLAWALTHPMTYLARAVWPGAASPLDVLPRVPVADWGPALVATIAAAVVVTATAQLASARAALATWGSYLLLLLPVIGLTPSGLQLTADRYMYGPALVLSAALAVALTRAPGGLRQAALVAAGAAAVLFGQTARAELAPWHDSVALWTRAVALDANNDVARYNLADAFVAAGQPVAAIAEYERLLALVPDHTLARERLNALRADAEEATADNAAAAGRLAEAATAYGRVLAFDGTRVDVRVKRGMALATRGELARALPDLEAGVAAGSTDPAVVSALAFSRVAVGRTADAITLLTDTSARHPDDLGLANNLARLLVTAEPATLRDPARALEISARITQATGGNDPRQLDTLALAFAASGQPDDARQAWTRAAELARAAGDAELASALDARLSAPRR
jgi:protein O-mannosyl-transferase